MRTEMTKASRNPKSHFGKKGIMAHQLERAGRVVLLNLGLALSVFLAISLLPGTAAAQSNPIVIENQQPGTSNWRIPYDHTGYDTNGEIKGYASAASVNKGEDITFYVSVNPDQTYTIDIYRLGWYQSLGGRLMQHIGPLNGVFQTTPAPDSTTGLIECNWTPSYTLTTQTSWTSGIYLAVLKNANGYYNYVIFAVRDDTRVADFLFLQPVLTYQAFNGYPDGSGKSFYSFNSFGGTTIGGTTAAVKISLDRPYAGNGANSLYGNCLLNWELAFIRWLERSGYDVTYATDIDTHINNARLLNYRGLLIPGHNEYTTKQMYDGYEDARDAGVNIGFFCANIMHHQVRLEPSSSNVPNRVVVYYGSASIDPNTDPSLETVLWRNPPLNRPEQTLVGVQFSNLVMADAQYQYAPYVVTNSGHWVYAGTGFQDADTVPGIVGYECDRVYSGVAEPDAISGTYTILSHSPYTAYGGPDFQNSSIYQAPSGAWVFGAGTVYWGHAVDDFNLSGPSLADARIQLMTANILDQFISNTPVGFSISASPSSQTVIASGSTSYNVTINPIGGFTGAVSLNVTGLPAGAEASFSPNPTTGTSALSVVTSPSTPVGSFTLTITGVSGSITRTTTAGLIVNPSLLPDFTLSASPASQTVVQGSSTTYSITITPTGGFTGDVTLSMSGLPVGASGSFTPNPATASSVLSVTTETSTPSGTYTLTITGANGSLTHTCTLTLVVSAPPIPDFLLSVSPASRIVTQGASTTYGVTITPTGGFGGEVTLSISGLPVGASGSFTPNPATGSSSFSVTAGASTPTGNYTLTFTGVAGNLTHTTTAVLTVAPVGVMYDNAVSSGFQWGVTSITTPAFVIGNDVNRAAMIMVVMAGNTATNITASLGGITGTLIPGADTGTTAAIRTLIFQVVNPPSGSQRATVSWTTSMNADVGVITVSGADQTMPCTNGTFAATNRNDGSAISLAITSNAGDLTASIGVSARGWVTPFTNQTIVWGIDSGVVGGDIGTGTGTTIHTWTDAYRFQMHAVSGANFQASVAQTPDFGLSASPSIRTIAQGGSTTYSVAIAPTGGFTGEVSLSISGLPAGASGSFSPNPTTGSSTLSVTTGTTTPTGDHTITITGISGTLTHTATVLLTVTAPVAALSSVSVNPTTVLGGVSSTGTVTLDNPAPTGGAVVSLSSSNTAAAQVPATVTVLAGATTATFTATTSPVTSNTAVTITALYNSVTRTATLTVTAAVLNSVSLSPTSVVGGSSSTGTVTLSGAAPVGGAVVSLSSSNTAAAQVPATVTVLAGATTATFTATTSTVTSNTVVTITALYNSVTRTTTLTVTAAILNSISLTPTSVVGGSSSTGTVTLSGAAPTGGAVVSLSSSNTAAAQVPATVTVLAGATTATFTATTSAVTLDTVVTITALYNSVTRGTTLTVTAPLGSGVVLYDNAVRSGFQWGVTSITTPAFVIGSGVNRAAMIMVVMSANTATNISASLGGIPGTLIPGTDTGTTASIRTMIFQVVNPPSGSQRATVSWTTSMSADVGVITVSGANQTMPCTNGTFAATNRNGGYTMSLVVSSDPGDLTASVGASARGWVTPFTNQTLVWGIDSGVVGGDIGPGTGTTTHTWMDAYYYQTHAVSGANFRAR